MPCKIRCAKCGASFDRFSGKLINISDEGLRDFYKTNFIEEFLKSENHKHPVLCVDCLVEELGRSLRFSDIKFKNGKWMTSNVAYLVSKACIDDACKVELIEYLKSIDKSGVLPIKHNIEGDKFISNLLNQK